MTEEEPEGMDAFHSTEISGSSAYILGQVINLPASPKARLPLPEISDRRAWQELPQHVRTKLIDEGLAALKADFPAIKASDLTRYSRDGNRSEFEALYFTRRHLLNALVMAELVENQGRFINAIADAAYMICEESGWQLPAHNTHKRGGKRAPLPDPEKPVLDLFAAETGTQISLLSVMLQKPLEAAAPGIVDRLQNEVRRRVITPYLAEKIWWMGNVDGPTNNWTSWCTQNVVMAALCLPLEGMQRRDILTRAIASLEAFLSELGDDGACPEGVFYYRHAGLCLWGALHLISLAAPDAIEPLWQHPKLRNIAEFIEAMHVGGNAYINFGDCPSINLPCTAREVLFAKAVGSKRLENFAINNRQTAGWSSLPGEVNLWYRALEALHTKDILSADAPAPAPRDVWYPSVGLMVTHDGIFTLAAKAGSNGESHNHNDVGSVTLYKNGRPVLIDIGVETYSAKTFSPQRYEIWTMQSGWHNLPTFGGFMQADGSAYSARDVEVSLGQDRSSLEMELASAWPPEADLQCCHRRATLIKGQSVVIEDVYESSHTAELNLIFAEKPEVSAQGLELLGFAQIALKGAREIFIETVEINDKRLLQSLPGRIYRARIAVAEQAIEITIT